MQLLSVSSLRDKCVRILGMLVGHEKQAILERRQRQDGSEPGAGSVLLQQYELAGGDLTVQQCVEQERPVVFSVFNTTKDSRSSSGNFAKALLKEVGTLKEIISG